MATRLDSTPRTPDTSRAGSGRGWLGFVVLALPLLLVSMDVSILYFAVPRITADLHASATQQLWIFDVYGFVLAGMLVTMGAVADRIGARRLLLIGAVAFSATSLFAAYAGSAGQLIAARAVLGIAGATLMPSTLSMIRTLFPDDAQRGRAVAAWTAIMTAGVGLGPVLSGVLLEHFWWGSVFLVNLPAMALLLLVGPFLLPETPRRNKRFDPASAVLSLAAVLPTFYGIKQWATEGTDVRWLACIAAGLVLGAVFARRQLRHPGAMISPRLLRNRRYGAAVLANAIATFALVGNAVFMTGYLQLVLGYSPLTAALWSLAPTLFVGGAAPAADAAVARRGPLPVAVAGLLVAASGFGVLALVGTDSLVVVLVGATLLAVGLVATMTVAAAQVLAALDPAEAGSGAAVSEAATELGGSMGIAVLGSVGAAGYQSAIAGQLPTGLRAGPAGESLPGALAVAAHLPGEAADAVVAAGRAAYVHGLHLAVLLGAALLVLAAVAAVVGSRSQNE